MRSSKTARVLLLLIMPLLANAENWNVRLVGKPIARRVVQKTKAYLGGDVELSAKVAVTDADGNPVPNLPVTLWVRATKSGVVGRLRAFGFTDRSGLATPRAVFDLPVTSLRVSIQACLAKPADECTPIVEEDLTQKTDVELHFGYQQVASSGTEFYRRGDKTEEFPVFLASTAYQVRPRFVFTPWETVRHSRHSAVSLHAGAAMTLIRNGVPNLSSREFGFGRVVTGASFLLESHLEGSVSFGPPLGGRPGHAEGQVLFNQAVLPRTQVFGGFQAYRSIDSSRVDTPQFGSIRGPLVGVSRQLKSGASRISGWVQYSFADESRFVDDKGTTLRQLPSRYTTVGVDWDYHRGGPIYTKFGVFVSQLGTAAPVAGVSVEITLRNMMKMLP